MNSLILSGIQLCELKQFSSKVQLPFVTIVLKTIEGMQCDMSRTDPILSWTILGDFGSRSNPTVHGWCRGYWAGIFDEVLIIGSVSPVCTQVYVRMGDALRSTCRHDHTLLTAASSTAQHLLRVPIRPMPVSFACWTF
jgi:hypothetical protein